MQFYQSSDKIIITEVNFINKHNIPILKWRNAQNILYKNICFPQNRTQQELIIILSQC